MSQHMAFRRQPVPGQFAQNLKVTTFAAPTSGIVQDQNEAFMRPGGAVVQDNWVPTMRGVKLRGGCERWCVLPETTPVISAFEYVDAAQHLMFAANQTKLYNVSVAATPVLVKSGQLSGNYAAAQLANAAGNWLLCTNDAGDFVLRFDGTAWITLNADQITGPAGTTVEHGHNLVYVWKYRNRLFFIEKNSMQAWYLGVDSIGGLLKLIPLSGAASKGGKLLFGATWSVDTGSGLDDKCVFATDQGELLIFSGSDPGNATTWKQEGRYAISRPLGINAHMSLGGDLLILTTDGIVPLTQALQKDSGALDLALITRAIRPMWRDEALTKVVRVHPSITPLPWSLKKWDEYGGIFIAWPGGDVGDRHCLVMNNATGAFCRFTGWDATCWIKQRDRLFFGTQGGIVMQADETGYDDGVPYVATLVGGWETFRSGSALTVWHQARAVFAARPRESFIPQLSATTDFIITIPPPPPAGPDPGPLDVWDEGLWDDALWDALPPPIANRNTMWVSVGMTGFSHAPIVQVQVAQTTAPDVELILIAATYEPAGVNV